MSKIGISIKVRVFRELEFEGCLFRCYESGRVERLVLVTNQHGKAGDWTRCDNSKPDYDKRCGRSTIYAKVNGKRYILHRIIYLAFNPTFDIYDNKRQIDHINGDSLDNRIKNLREATGVQNAYNRKASNKLGLKNICDRGNRWEVRINKDGKRVVCKSFHKRDYTLDDVIQFRDDELLVHHGEFARL